MTPIEMEVNKYRHGYGKRPSAYPFSYLRYSWIWMAVALANLWSWTLYDHEREELFDGKQPA
jgi:hypothetical protein